VCVCLSLSTHTPRYVMCMCGEVCVFMYIRVVCVMCHGVCVSHKHTEQHSSGGHGEHHVPQCNTGFKGVTKCNRCTVSRVSLSNLLPCDHL
jgi:hypothetical protein